MWRNYIASDVLLYRSVFISRFFLHERRRDTDIVTSCRSGRILRRNPADLHSETIRFLPFSRRFFSDMANEGRGSVKQGGQEQVNERADLDVEIGRRRIVRAAPDRKASQSAHSASISPFPSAICLVDLSLSLSFFFCFRPSPPRKGCTLFPSCLLAASGAQERKNVKVKIKYLRQYQC